MGTLPWGWHEDRAAPALPNVGEHDDVALTMPEHDAMRDIAAHWEDEVPCAWTEGRCEAAAQWIVCCTSACSEHRQVADESARRWHSQGGITTCPGCEQDVPFPLPWRRL